MNIGVDIGGSKILVAAGSDQHEIIRSQNVATPSTPDAALSAILNLVEEVRAGENISAFGVGSAGTLDRQKGLTHGAPASFWSAPLVLAPALSDRFDAPVRLENDAAAAALAEATIGAGADHPYMLYVTLSTGIGTGLILNGEIYHGANDLEAGHIIVDPDGPVCECGGRGHFQATSSGIAIKRRYGKYGYEIKDPAIWNEIAGTMAVGFYNLITSYAPSIVVVGGGVGVHFDQFGEFLIRHLNQLKPRYPLPPIVQAKYVETAVIYGALILASKAEKVVTNR